MQTYHEDKRLRGTIAHLENITIRIPCIIQKGGWYPHSLRFSRNYFKLNFIPFRPYAMDLAVTIATSIWNVHMSEYPLYGVLIH